VTCGNEETDIHTLLDIVNKEPGTAILRDAILVSGS
jgi:hypothetical protein